MTQMRDALVSARAALLRSGFVGAGAHGSGDPEVNLIDAALKSEDAAENGLQAIVQHATNDPDCEAHELATIAQRFLSEQEAKGCGK